MIEILGIVLAGGRGERLYPLTKDRAKPAVPFGGKYRIIDFVLSNFVNSGIFSIYVLTQFKSQSLIEHLDQGWRLSDFLQDRFITAVPAQMRVGDEWYQGTADSVYQNLYLIERHHPELVAVFGADHIYRMNIRQMIDEHRAKDAHVTVAVLPVPREEGVHFGVIQVDSDWRIVGFEEKPSDPKPIPQEPDYALISMGNYLFNTDVLTRALTADAAKPDSRHDFGYNILPSLITKRKVFAYDFRKNRIPLPLKKEEASYWRDVGNIETYYQVNMDLRNVDPAFNLYNQRWPIRTVGYGDPPAKFVFDEEGRRGSAVNSIVGEGTIISGSLVRGSVIGRNVRIHSYCLIEDSILLDWVEIGRGCRIRRTIIDKNNIIPPGTEIGYNLERDRQRYFVSEGDIVVIPRAQPKATWMLQTP
ncbi:MAG TPA: glucose-1-phosphate adenylyltransferase [Candidatus Acidoferrales bacterium]|nr:glucose-1-phosphate adenylyltransferase [Candidatus Acidoferrales bacterium]